MKDDGDIKVNRIQPVSARVTHLNADERRNRHQKKHKKGGRTAVRHFQELVEAAEKSHQKLTNMNSPYRFCVYQEDDEVFIDVVILGEDGKIKAIQKKNITDDEFVAWLNHIENGYGLLLDSKI